MFRNVKGRDPVTHYVSVCGRGCSVTHGGSFNACGVGSVKLQEPLQSGKPVLCNGVLGGSKVARGEEWGNT